MSSIFMLYNTSCLLFICFTRLHVICFYVLQDFMSSVFMIYKTSCFMLLCFMRLQCLLFLCITRLHVFYFFILYETSMSSIFILFKTSMSMSFAFMRYKTSMSSILCFYRTSRSSVLCFKSSMSFFFIGFTILFSLLHGIELQDRLNEISVIIFSYLLFSIKDKERWATVSP